MTALSQPESFFYILACGVRGLRLVFSPGLRRYVVVPVLLNLLVFGTAFLVSEMYFAQFLNWLIPDWLEWLRWLLWPVFGLVFLIFALFNFSLIANLIGCLFYGRLARKVESRVLDDHSRDPSRSNEPGWIAALASEVARLGYYMSRSIVLLLLFLVPGVNLFAPFLWLCFSAWFLGMEYIAYPLEECGLTFPDQRRLMRAYRMQITAFGALVLASLTIPFFNLVAPPAAVIGATIYVQNKKPD